MQRRSAKGSIRLCTVLGDLVPMGFRASVCIYVIDTNCLSEGERIGSALCGCPTDSGGCCVGRTSERCSVGPEARRGFCPRAVSRPVVYQRVPTPYLRIPGVHVHTEC